MILKHLEYNYLVLKVYRIRNANLSVHNIIIITNKFWNI